MKLNPQQQKIYDFLRDHGEATIVQLRNALFIAKPDMRISEINHAYREEHGTDLIVTVKKKENGEHVKGLAVRLTKKVQRVEVKDNVAHVYYETVNV